MGGGSDPKPENLLVILPFPEPVEVFERIKKNHPHIQITFRRLAFGTFDEGLKEIPKELFHDATILVTLSSLPKSPEDCPNLKLIHFFSAGVNHVANSPIYTDTSIPLTTSSGKADIHSPQLSCCSYCRPGIHGPQIAEWVTMTALVRSHSYNLLHDWQTQHHWGKGSTHPALRSNPDYVGQRLGVLGYGSIGRQVARVCAAMGMSVIAYTAHPRPTPASKRDPGFIVPNTGDPDGTIPCAWFSGLDKPSIHNFLSQNIDILLVSVPLTASTTHLLGEEEFDILGRRNAFVSNISRGQILVQEALVAALRVFEEGTREGKTGEELRGLRGAALDVTDPEPLPEGHELWDAPNCIVTPHISGLGSAYADRAFQVLEVNLDRRERGEKMINVVNRKEGY